MTTPKKRSRSVDWRSPTYGSRTPICIYMGFENGQKLPGEVKKVLGSRLNDDEEVKGIQFPDALKRSWGTFCRTHIGRDFNLLEDYLQCLKTSLMTVEDPDALASQLNNCEIIHLKDKISASTYKPRIALDNFIREYIRVYNVMVGKSTITETREGLKLWNKWSIALVTSLIVGAMRTGDVRRYNDEFDNILKDIDGGNRKFEELVKHKPVYVRDNGHTWHHDDNGYIELDEEGLEGKGSLVNINDWDNSGIYIPSGENSKAECFRVTTKEMPRFEKGQFEGIPKSAIDFINESDDKGEIDRKMNAIKDLQSIPNMKCNEGDISQVSDALKDAWDGDKFMKNKIEEIAGMMNAGLLALDTIGGIKGMQKCDKYTITRKLGKGKPPTLEDFERILEDKTYLTLKHDREGINERYKLKGDDVMEYNRILLGLQLTLREGAEFMRDGMALRGFLSTVKDFVF